MPRRGPETGVIHIQYDFHSSAVKRIDSCLFLQSQIIFFSVKPVITLLSLFLPRFGAGNRVSRVHCTASA